ncbi:MAG: hypothetical protein JST00_13495 [Deltaproteobacteria bacterium]|nr:hypothetical protein [Deltaproteobacteria bacterium]
MRARFPLLGLFALAACGHAAQGTSTVKTTPEARQAAGPSSGPPQYVVADPGQRGGSISISLGPSGIFGMVVDKARIVVGRGEPRVGADFPDQPITGAVRIPTRFKGGFLFWTDDVVYRSEAFDGRLEPVARFQDGIAGLSFAPKYLLVRTRNGERWAVSPTNGERVNIEPLGVVDIEGLDDGRVLAFNDQGALFSSLDHGAHWTDVTAHIKSSPQKVAVVDDELWLFESSGGALRLDPDGQLSSFDKQPTEKSADMRQRDPRWRGLEAPLRAVFQYGAAIDESTAVVIEQGDLVRVDTRTGEIVGIVSGKLPPDARCFPVPTTGDVLFACLSRNAQPGYVTATSFVVSHTITGEAPVIEQTFAVASHFYASDDGGLVFEGPCSGAPSSSLDHVVCVRQPGGTWQDADLSALGADAGAGTVTVARWVPRADGRVVALLTDPHPAIYDPRSGALVAIDGDARSAIAAGPSGYAGRYRGHLVPGFDGGHVVDAGWTYTSNGSLRGWHRQGGIVEIDGDGKTTRSPYSFEIASAGPYGLGRTAEGRLYQSTDHGATWTEVATPPSGMAAGELRGCSTAGCDLGGFYRIGWQVRPPRAEAAPTPSRAAPDVRRHRPLELACRSAGAAQVKSLRRTESSPEDLGLGATRLQVAGERTEIAFVRFPVLRSIVNPIHDAPTGDSDNPSLRALLTGFATTQDGDTLVVQGPTKSIHALRRGVSFVPPFDPAAPVRKASIAMSDVIAAGRSAGLTTEEILQDDMTESGSVALVTPADANAPGDLVLQHPRGLLAVIRANERVKIAMRVSQNDGSTVVSAVSLPGDDVAFLELEGSGVGHVFRTSGSTTSDLFDVSPTIADTGFYPANPDALAINAKGDLAILRTASGSDPASAADPAILMVPSMPPVALAPWSTLRTMDDPACKEPGWRATLQTILPWVRITSPELRVLDIPMVARVKWNEKRVCLEGLEVKLPDVSMRVPGAGGHEPLKVGSWLVLRGNTFTRVAVADGVEWRQPMECTVVPPPAKP